MLKGSGCTSLMFIILLVFFTVDEVRASELFSKLLKFSPLGFEVVDRRLSTTDVNFEGVYPRHDENNRMLKMVLTYDRDEGIREEYIVILMECEGILDTWSVYYRWAKEKFGSFKALFNAFPPIYAYIEGRVDDTYYVTWIKFKRLFSVKGPDKERVRDLYKLLKKFMSVAEPSGMT